MQGISVWYILFAKNYLAFDKILFLVTNNVLVANCMR